jgi:uncharacterized membrane protein HdeD (DUF308 family)
MKPQRTALSDPPPAPAETRPPRGGVSSPLRIYLLRGIIALVWAIGFATVSRSLTAGSVAFLISYPVIDLVASLADPSERRGTPARKKQLWNAGLSALTAVALGVASAGGIAAVLHVFGAWAIVSGAVQLIAALRRRGPDTGTQWPMLVAGGLSTIVGIVYQVKATGDDPRLGDLVTYAAAGGAFFVIQAGLLARRLRKTQAARS